MVPFHVVIYAKERVAIAGRVACIGHANRRTATGSLFADTHASDYVELTVHLVNKHAR